MACAQRQPFGRQPAAFGLALRRRAVDGDVQAEERIRSTPPANRCQTPAGRRPWRCCRRPGRARRARVRCWPLHTASLRRHRAGRGTAASTRPRRARQPRNVGGIDRLDVLEPVPAAAVRAPDCARRGLLEGVERHPDRAIADGVNHDLPAASIELGHEPIERRPPTCAARRCAPAGWRTARACAAVCDSMTPSAISLMAPGLEQRIVGVSRAQLRRTRRAASGVKSAAGRTAPDRPGRQLAGAAQLVVELEIFGGAAGVLHAGDAVAVRLGDGGAHRGQRALRASAAAAASSTSPIAASLSTPVGSPVRGSLTMTPFAGLARAARDAWRASSAAEFAQPVWPS